MIAFVLALILLAISLLGVAMRKVYYYLPAKELKRQAEAGDMLARKLWQVVSYGPSLRLYMWLWVGLTAAAGFLILARVAPWPLGLIVTLLVILMAFAWFPSRPQVTGVESRLTRLVTPLLAWQLHYAHPLLSRLFAPVAKRQVHSDHTNLYETADLLELLSKQQTQADNRISPADLERAKRALTAHHYKVSDVLLPRSEVKTVSDTDTIGLVMLDELHAAGQASFPVCQGKTDKIIGMLYLSDLGLKTEGRVRDYMQPGVKYLHEDDTLDQALQAFYKTRHQSFVVVNSFEEYVGLATLEAVTRQLAGEAAPDDFDQHNDVAAVAAKHDNDNEPEPEPEVSEAVAEPDEVAVPAPEDELAPADEGELPTEAASDEPASDDNLDDDFEAVEEDPEPVEQPEPAEAEEAPRESSETASAEDEEPEQADEVNPDNLAALDLPEDEEVPAEQPKKSGSAKSDDEVVE